MMLMRNKEQLDQATRDNAELKRTAKYALGFELKMEN
jgi:hypothetical protein